MSLKFARSGCRLLLLLGVAFVAAPGVAQTTYTQAFTAPPAAVTVLTYSDTIRPTGGSATFNRPALDTAVPLTALSHIGTNVPYDAHTFTVTTAQAGNYRIVCDSTLPTAWDNCLYLYSGSFSAASPLTNCIAGNNAVFGTGHSSFINFHLSPGTYTLVVTSYYNGVAGSFTESVTSASNAAVHTFNATLNNAPTWNRPEQDLKTLSADATAVPYYVYNFTPQRSGTYSFLSECANLTDWDDFTFLYRTSFNPATPISNLVAGNDDLNGLKSSGFSYSLTAGTQYVYVTTSAANQSYGDFNGYITAPGSVTLYTLSGQTTAPPAVFPTFNRPQISGSATPNSLDSTADSVYYKAHPFTVTANGLYNFKSVCTTPASWENVMVLYKTSFDPAAPLTNAVFAVGGNSPTTEVIENVRLTAGFQYIWVTTSFLNGEGGNFQNTLYTGGAAFPPTIPDNSYSGLPLTLAVTDTYPVAALNKVVITGLNHSSAGDLLATLTHNGVTIELFDRIGATTAGDYGSGAAFSGDYMFAAGGADIGAAAQSATISPTVSYAPFLNGTAGQSSQFTGDFTAFNGMNATGDWTLTLSDLAAQYIGSYTGFSLTMTPQTVASASGILTLEGAAPFAPAQTITFTCRPVSSGVTIVKTATVASNGQFTITGLPLRAYIFHIKGFLYLAVNIPADLTAGNVTGLTAFLPVGDTNNDNSIDPTDFNAFVSAYNASYDPTCDFDFDGLVGPSDFNLFVGNYNKVGDP